MPVRISGEVEDVGILKVPFVAVGRAENCQDQLATRYSRALNLYLLACVALGRHLHGRGVTQQLLDRRFYEQRFVPEPLHLLGMLEEEIGRASCRERV